MNETLERQADDADTSLVGIDSLGLGIALGKSIPQHKSSQLAAPSFSAAIRTMTAMRDSKLISDSQFTELIETACTVMIEQRISSIIDRIVEHQINTNMLAKILHTHR